MDKTNNPNLVLNMSIPQLLSVFFKNESPYRDALRYDENLKISLYFAISEDLFDLLDIQILGEFKITVDYNLTYAEMIKAGYYSNEKYLLSDTSLYEAIVELEPKNKIADKKEITGKLFYSDEEFFCIDGFMQRAGYRMASIQELLAFGSQHPKIQQVSPIQILSYIPIDDELPIYYYVTKLNGHHNSTRALTFYKETYGEEPINSLPNCFLGIKEE